MRGLATGLILLTGLLACNSGADEEAALAAAEAEAQAKASEFAAAQAAYDPAGFDTISWETPQAALERGATVFRFSCQKCHGPTGEGDAGFILNGAPLTPPSFIGDDWQFAEDPDGLRQQVFTGTMDGMPHWGLEGLKYRDVDAVTKYILGDLR